MSGFVRNDWGQYLNGGSSHYNFEYRSRNTDVPLPSPELAPMPITSESRKTNKVVIPAQKGGKKKSLRSRHNHKRSNKNKSRRTHRK